MAENLYFLKLKKPITVDNTNEIIVYKYFMITSYATNGALAVALTPGLEDSYDTIILSVNLDEQSLALPQDEFFLDINNLDKSLVQQLDNEGYIKPAPESAISGYVVYPAVHGLMFKQCERVDTSE